MSQIAIYARVSSRAQAESGTIQSQVAAVKDFVQQQGWEVDPAHIYLDEGVSGQRLARPGLDRLRDAAVTGAFDTVVCLSPDRLAREIGVQYAVLNALEQAGVQVVFVNQPELGDDAQSRLLRTIQGAVADYERSIMQDRMRRGRRYRLQQGESMPIGAPYGYRYTPAREGVKAQWRVVPSEAEVVRQLFSWYAEGEGGFSELARRLNAQGIPSPRGRLWSESAIRRILTQPAYRGVAYYGRHRTDMSAVGSPRKIGHGRLQYPRYERRPVEEWIEVPVEAIVSESLWQAVQERIQMNARYARRNSRRTYLLRGLLVCQVCGHTLQGMTYPSGKVVYRCIYGGTKCPPETPEHRCIVPEKEALPLIWGLLRQLLHHPQRLEQAWQAHLGLATPQEERSRWQQRRDMLERHRRRLQRGYEAKIYTLEEAEARIKPLDMEIQALEKQLAETEQPSVAPAFDLFRQQIGRALQTADVETKQEVIRLLIEHIVVSSDNTLTVVLGVPFEEELWLPNTLRNA